MKQFNFLKGITFLIATIFLTGTVFSKDTSLTQLVSKVESKLGVQIIYDRKVRDSWGGSRYQLPREQKVKDYLILLEREFSKYPAGFLKRAKANKIILTSKYSFQGNKQAAMPDPYGNRLYLAIDGAYGVAHESYLVHVMHHELNHNTEYAIWQNQYYKWPEWSELNNNFTYGQGGITAYTNQGIDYYSASHPREGFINLYSMTGEEEDRSEIIAFLMTDSERPAVIKICEKDHIVRAKAQKIADLIDSFKKPASGKSYLRKAAEQCYGAAK